MSTPRHLRDLPAIIQGGMGVGMSKWIPAQAADVADPVTNMPAARGGGYAPTQVIARLIEPHPERLLTTGVAGAEASL